MTQPEYRPHELVWDTAKVARLWDYYGLLTHPGYHFSAESGHLVIRRVEREVELHGRRVLDFGCGRGDLLVHLVQRGVQVAGLEFSATSAAETRRRLQDEPLFHGVTLAEALPSDLADASFDVVFLVEVLEHLLDEQVAPTLDEVFRLLTPAGHVVATSPNNEDLAVDRVRCPECGATFQRWQHMRSLRPDSIAALFEEHGFEARLACGVYWGVSWATKLLLKLRHPFGRAAEPHLLYVGVKRAV